MAQVNASGDVADPTMARMLAMAAVVIVLLQCLFDVRILPDWALAPLIVALVVDFVWGCLAFLLWHANN